MNKVLSLVIIFVLNTCISFAQLPNIAKETCPLPLGSEVPDVQLLDTDNKHVSIREAITGKPTILIFYRGGWCPYCNAHLAEVGKIESEILTLGYQVIAISPDQPKELNLTIDKKELKYTLLSDGSGTFAKSMGIAFKAPDKKWKTKQLQKYSGGKNKGYLPVPSIFILNKKGEIVFEYVNPNYRTRLSGELLLAVLKKINS